MTDSPEQLRQLLLVSSGGQSQGRISFTLPAHRASHKIKSAVISIGFFFQISVLWILIGVESKERLKS